MPVSSTKNAAVVADSLNSLDTAKVAASLGPWVAKHRESVSRPRIESYVAEARILPLSGSKLTKVKIKKGT